MIPKRKQRRNPQKKLADLGGEPALLSKLVEFIKPAASKLIPIGDDCAMIPHGKGFLLLTVGTLVEGTHFTTGYMAPQQIGRKAIEAGISDIASCGGLPAYAAISLILPKRTAVAFLGKLYRGITHACQRYGIKIIGGDMTRGRRIAVNVTLLGHVERTHLCRRSGARIGDLLAVTGPLGKSAAGLALLHAGHARARETRPYKEPRANLERARAIAPYVHAMIDISDGLASETRHLCFQSGTGARIEKKDIPLAASTVRVAQILGKNAYTWALRGGEDFQLLFAVAPEVYRQRRALFAGCTVVGTITPRREGIRLIRRDRRGLPRREELGPGYEHFT